MRTCMGCGARAPQAALLRVVRDADGALAVDRAAPRRRPRRLSASAAERAGRASRRARGRCARCGATVDRPARAALVAELQRTTRVNEGTWRWRAGCTSWRKNGASSPRTSSPGSRRSGMRNKRAQSSLTDDEVAARRERARARREAAGHDRRRARRDRRDRRSSSSSAASAPRSSGAAPRRPNRDDDVDRAAGVDRRASESARRSPCTSRCRSRSSPPPLPPMPETLVEVPEPPLDAAAPPSRSPKQPRRAESAEARDAAPRAAAPPVAEPAAPARRSRRVTPPAAERPMPRSLREPSPERPFGPQGARPHRSQEGRGRTRRRRARPRRARRTRGRAAPARTGDAAAAEAAGADRPRTSRRQEEEAPRHREAGVRRDRAIATDASRRGCRARSARCPARSRSKTEITTPKASKRVVRISEVITVGELAKAMGVKAGEVIKKLMDTGMMATINQVLDVDTATLIASEFDYNVENVAFDAESALEVGHEAERARSICSRGRRWSRSWATSTTARRRCSMRSARPTSPPARPAASRSTSVPTRVDVARPPRHLPRYAGPRGVHRHACPRRQGDRHRRAGGRRRRRRDAADGRGHQSRARRRACRSSWPINKIDKPEANLERIKQELGRSRPGARRLGRRHDLRAGVGEDQARASRSCSRCCCCRPTCSS